MSHQSIGLDPQRALRVWWLRVGWFSFGFFPPFTAKILSGVLAAQICTFQILLGAVWGMGLVRFSNSRL